MYKVAFIHGLGRQQQTALLLRVFKYEKSEKVGQIR